MAEAGIPTHLALKVATPLGVALDLEVDSVEVPGAVGELGVLPGHVPILAALKPGVLRYRKQGKVVVAAVGAGYVEANGKHVRLIAEFFSRPEDVDVEEAKKDLEKVEQKLKAFQGQHGDPAHLELQREQDWARARLDVVAN